MRIVPLYGHQLGSSPHQLGGPDALAYQQWFHPFIHTRYQFSVTPTPRRGIATVILDPDVNLPF